LNNVNICTRILYMAMPAQTKYVVLSILFILASINFTRTALEILENSKRLDSLSQEVGDMEEEKKEYTNSVAYKKTDEYVEEKARDDLSMIRPGEKVYVIPQEFKVLDLESKVLGQKSVSQKLILGKFGEDSNVAKWLRLFIK